MPLFLEEKTTKNCRKMWLHQAEVTKYCAFCTTKNEKKSLFDAKRRKSPRCADKRSSRANKKKNNKTDAEKQKDCRVVPNTDSRRTGAPGNGTEVSLHLRRGCAIL